MKVRIATGIRSLPVFPSASEEQILRKYNLQKLIKMGANENCYGASPHVKEALRTASAEHRYPDAYGLPLRSQLAERLNIEESCVLLGNGSTELVEMIAKTFLQPGDSCLTAHETFPIYKMAVLAANGNYRTVPLRDDRFNLEAMLSAIASSTRLIFLANPNNPTGTTVSEEDLTQFLAAVPPEVVVVIDEAYREYARKDVNRVKYIDRFENLILLRTFSKVYGLAGLRIGYAVCSPGVAQDFQRASMPYSINAFAQIAGAAALADSEHVTMCVRQNAQQRELVQKKFADRGYRFVSSEANFILLRVANAEQLKEELLRKGILVAHVSHFNIPDGIRITFGLPEENDYLLRVLGDLL